MCHQAEAPHLSDPFRGSFAQGIAYQHIRGLTDNEGAEANSAAVFEEAEKAFRFRDEKSRFRSFLQNIEGGGEKMEPPTWFDF